MALESCVLLHCITGFCYKNGHIFIGGVDHVSDNFAKQRVALAPSHAASCQTKSASVDELPSILGSKPFTWQNDWQYSLKAVEVPRLGS